MSIPVRPVRLRRLTLASGLLGLAALASCDSPAAQRSIVVASLAGTGAGSVTSEPAGLDCGTSCQAEFEAGATVKLTAKAAPDSTFSGWAGACEGSDASCTLKAEAGTLMVTAVFNSGAQPNQTYDLTVTKTGPGAVRAAAAGIDCGTTCTATLPAGTQVTLTAAPDAGAAFRGWGGACQGGAATCQVTVSQAQSVTASFAALTCSPDGVCWEEPSPDGIDRRAVFALSPSDIWAVGSAGSIDHFDGTAWRPSASGVTGDLTDVWASGPTDVYATSASGPLLRYNGTQWAPVAGVTSASMAGIWGANASNIWVIESGAKVVRYNGTTWAESTIAGANTTLAGIGGTAADDVWVSDAGGNMSRWSGTAWAVSKIATRPLAGVSAVSKTEAWTADNAGNAWRWNGTAWSMMATGKAEMLRDVYAPAAGDVWAVGDGGALLHYDGTKWSDMSVRPRARLYGVHGTGAGSVQFVGTGNARFSWNGQKITDLTPRAIDGGYAVFGLGAASVWVGGSSGQLAHFDGGTWKAYAAGVPMDFTAIWGAGEQAVFAAGLDENLDGVILRWNGTAWAKMTLPAAATGNGVNAIHGVGASEAWAVGDTKMVLRYDGTAWTAVTTPATGNLAAVYAGAAGDVWAAGRDDLMHLKNGTWTRDTSLGTGIVNITALGGTGPGNVWVATSGGNVWQYDGTKWNERSVGVTASFRAVAALGATDVVLAGTNGALYRFDGTTKATLLRLPGEVKPTLYGLWAESANKVWVASLSGIASIRK